MKKMFLRVVSCIALVGAVVIGMNTSKSSQLVDDSNLANIISVSMANSEGTVDGCDKDPNDSCWDSETGHKTTDCDPSSFWDTCGS